MYVKVLLRSLNIARPNSRPAFQPDQGASDGSTATADSATPWRGFGSSYPTAISRIRWVSSVPIRDDAAVVVSSIK